MSEGSMLHGQQKQAGIPALLAQARFGVVVRPPYYRWNGERFERYTGPRPPSRKRS